MNQTRSNNAGISRLLNPGSTIDSLWAQDDFDSLLTHQLDSPLRRELESLTPELRKGVADLPVAETFRDVLTSPTAPLAHLELIKDWAKALDKGDRPLPTEVLRSLYFAAIAVAVSRGLPLPTTLNPSEVKKGIAWCLAQTWIDAGLRPALEQASLKL